MRVRRIVRRMAVAGMLAVMLIAVPTLAAAQRLGEVLGTVGSVVGVIVGTAACAATAPACVAAAAVVGGVSGSVIGSVIDGEASGRVETGPIPIGGNEPEPVPSSERSDSGNDSGSDQGTGEGGADTGFRPANGGNGQDAARAAGWYPCKWAEPGDARRSPTDVPRGEPAGGNGTDVGSTPTSSASWHWKRSSVCAERSAGRQPTLTFVVSVPPQIPPRMPMLFSGGMRGRPAVDLCVPDVWAAN